MAIPRHWRRPKVVALLSAGALVVGGLTAVTATSFAASTSTPYGNLSEALQKSLYFYDAEKSGASRTLDRQPLEWRGDSEPADAEIPLTTADGTTATGSGSGAGTNLPASFISQYQSVLDPDGDGTIDLSGGFHDAGDHVKFGLPQSYTASTIGWGVYEFQDEFVATGTYEHAMDELRWVSDYFLRSIFRDSSGEVVAFNYMVGNGTIDHTYWGPPELQDAAKYARPATFATATTPASDQAAGASAALTIMSLLTADSDPSYSTTCLDNAAALYDFAVQYRGLGNSDGFYNSSFDEDEMSWAAVWLYIATDTEGYLTDIVGQDESGNYTGYLQKIIHSTSDTWQNIWVHSWDTVWGGVFAKLAPASEGAVSAEENAKYWYYFKWNLEYWTGGEVEHDNASDTTFMASTDAGFQVINTWGSARYNAAAQLCAMVYRKYAPDDPKSSQLTDWALGQMNYIMGDNPLSRSYIVGFGESYAEHPHHRAAHGSTTNSMLVPAEHRHTLWGALVGGPDSDDQHNDVTTDFVSNEVAIDYNAGLVGALAGLYRYYGAGQASTAWTPPAEPEEDELYAMGKLEQENDQRTQVTLTINNYLTHPPHWETELSLRYYFDISELMEHGQDISAITAEVYYDESASSYGAPATLSDPIAADAASGIYYVEVSWPDIAIYGKREFQFGLISAQDSNWQSWWDGSNDFSHTGLTSTESARSDYVPAYRAGVLVAGNEPSGTTPDPSTSASPDTSASASPSASPSGSTGLKAQYTALTTSETSGDIRFELDLVNTGTTAVDLTDVTVRYWYTRDNTVGQTYSCDYAVLGCANVTGTFAEVSPARTGADAYLQLAFTSGSVGPNSRSGQIQSRFFHNDWTQYTQTGDYSFDASKTSPSDWTHVTVYHNGVLIWGAEP
ncbi:MAG: glycoside hydrolase family 9 [Dactylosporangium sp.]|nr:glycoside hydrolase family 9 protein [Dactylosporangium sp.]NNJ62516.1 glycoside hydrolase family 9 [Dactylosporangium sp.]